MSFTPFLFPAAFGVSNKAGVYLMGPLGDQPYSGSAEAWAAALLGGNALQVTTIM